MELLEFKVWAKPAFKELLDVLGLKEKLGLE
jgi:hypothetical protein